MRPFSWAGSDERKSRQRAGRYGAPSAAARSRITSTHAETPAPPAIDSDNAPRTRKRRGGLLKLTPALLLPLVLAALTALDRCHRPRRRPGKEPGSGSDECCCRS